jgi:hypothetical protein
MRAKLSRLLEHIGSATPPGCAHVFDPNKDWPLYGTDSSGEAAYVAGEAVRLGYLERERPDQPGIYYKILTPGWDLVERPDPRGDPSRVFVAMAFSKSLESAYSDGIFPAIEMDCKLKAVRIDKIPHSDKICDRVLGEIRTCRLLVADFTYHRQSVYFEAGFALALGRTVIWTCRRGDRKGCGFDTRQYKHIEWDAPAELRERLAEHIKAQALDGLDRSIPVVRTRDTQAPTGNQGRP